jgi:predicted AAA+ superfamily ATPase
MITRKYMPELAEVGQYFPVLGIIRPRQACKTTLVKSFMDTLDKPAAYLDLEKPSDFSETQ